MPKAQLHSGCPNSCASSSLGAHMQKLTSSEPFTRSSTVRLLPFPHLESHRLPPIGQARAVLQQELHRQQPLKHAASVAKQLLHIAINATASTVARHLTDRDYEATAAITTLTGQVRAAAEATCQHLSEQPATGRQHYTTRNRNFFHLEGIEAAYITHLVGGLHAEEPNASIVLLHDGLLIAPLPTQATLARLHQEALAKLQLSHHEAYNHIVHQLPVVAPGTQHTLEAAIKAVNLTALRQAAPTSQTYTHDARPKPTTYATLDAYFRRTAKRS